MTDPKVLLKDIREQLETGVTDPVGLLERAVEVLEQQKGPPSVGDRMAKLKSYLDREFPEFHASVVGGPPNGELAYISLWSKELLISKLSPGRR